jgi:allantoicase
MLVLAGWGVRRRRELVVEILAVPISHEAILTAAMHHIRAEFFTLNFLPSASQMGAKIAV